MQKAKAEAWCSQRGTILERGSPRSDSLSDRPAGRLGQCWVRSLLDQDWTVIHMSRPLLKLKLHVGTQKTDGWESGLLLDLFIFLNEGTRSQTESRKTILHLFSPESVNRDIPTAAGCHLEMGEGAAPQQLCLPTGLIPKPICDVVNPNSRSA